MSSQVTLTLNCTTDQARMLLSFYAVMEQDTDVYLLDTLMDLAYFRDLMADNFDPAEIRGLGDNAWAIWLDFFPNSPDPFAPKE